MTAGDQANHTQERPLERQVFRGLLLFAAAGLAVWAFGLILAPFLAPIAWALCLAAVTAKPYRAMTRRTRRPRLSAFVMVLTTTVVIVGPLLVLAALLAEEVRSVDLSPVQQNLRAHLPEAADEIDEWILRIGLVEADELPPGERPLSGLLSGIEAQLPGYAARLVSGPIAGGAVSVLLAPFFFLFAFLVMLVTLYFVYCESGRLRRLVQDLSPLEMQETDQILETLRATTTAAILGGIVVALAQGFLGGLAFVVVGVENAILWGLVMAGASLLPFGGTALVWLPVAIYLLVTGQTWQGWFLIAWGSLIVGAADNLLRPWILVRTGARDIHPMLLFFAILSGIGLFGISGIVFGPLLLALLITVVRIYRAHFTPDGPALGQ